MRCWSRPGVNVMIAQPLRENDAIVRGHGTTGRRRKMDRDRYEKYAFRMQLNPGMADGIRAASPRRSGRNSPRCCARRGCSDYSIHLDEETGCSLRRPLAKPRPRHGRTARPSGDEALVGPHGGHHGDQARQRAGGSSAPPGLLDGVAGVTMTFPGRVFVAVLDVGKTNAKVVLHDLGTARTSSVRTTAEHGAPRRPLSAFRRRLASSPSCSTALADIAASIPSTPSRSPPTAPRRRWSATTTSRCRCSTTSIDGPDALAERLRPRAPAVFECFLAAPARRAQRRRAVLLAAAHLPGRIRARCATSSPIRSTGAGG